MQACKACARFVGSYAKINHMGNLSLENSLGIDSASRGTMFILKRVIKKLLVLPSLALLLSGFTAARPLEAHLPVLPSSLPAPDSWGVLRLPAEANKLRPLTIVPTLQDALTKYIKGHGNPIAAIVIVDANNGHILAMAQGRDPELWGAKTHSALYEGFPAASIFKMVSTVAALDMADLQPDSVLGLTGGCAKVYSRGGWMSNAASGNAHPMSLSSAFSSSCNSFYAKLTVEYLGVGVVNNYAEKLGWGRGIQSDFFTPTSPINPPQPAMSAIHTVGKYAAGFGLVGLSAIHAAWISLLVARDGMAAPLRIFAENSPYLLKNTESAKARLISEKGALKLRAMMHETVRVGTASSAFRSLGMGKIKSFAAGKTGTLNSQAPLGLATWFVGLMPYDAPQVVVSAVVVNQGKWVIKGANLAAEGLRLWQEYKDKEIPNNLGQLGKAEAREPKS